MKSLLSFILTRIARLYLWRYKPSIVAITGNAGKTSAREAIFTVLKDKYRVRSSGANLNTPLGIAATIVGAPMDVYERQGGTAGFWWRTLFVGIGRLFSDAQPPEIIVLEYGADKPGDIKRLTNNYPPHVSVVTQVGEVPVHVEFFASTQHLANEKMQIIKHLSTQDHSVLNYDDQTVLDMRSHTQAHVHTFGFGEGADTRIENLGMRADGNTILGVGFDVASNGYTMPLVVSGTVGRGIANACAVAVAVGEIYGVGLADAVGALVHMQAPPGRLRILKGIRDTTIIDDSYNSSPAATHLALDTVKNLPAVRRVIVLGDMLELGEHTILAHQAVGDMAGDVADVLVCVGERAIFIADSAANQMDVANIHRFHDANEAKLVAQSLIRPGDVVLIKGSQGMRMERIVEELMAEPNRAGELLVRQSARWRMK